MAFAQRYETHAVKEGETLQGIAKQYRVTPYTILQSNKEIKSAADVKPNMLLVVPLEGSSIQDLTVVTEEGEQKKSQIEPIAFIKHRVRRKETIFSIVKRYDITEEQLKKYNKALYASTLQKGMVLQIPKYPKTEDKDEQAIDFEIYTVQPKETRWSIAHKYGITIDSLVLLNPELPKHSSYLAEGQQLKLPRLKGDSLEEQKVAIFESYTVPRSIGIYRISQEYGISSDSIIKLNPEIIAQNGLKEGMILRLPKRQLKSEIVNTENYIFYEVKPKQNIFRLTQNLRITREELFELNPDLANGLKAGMVLKLPKEKTGELEVKNALVLDNIDLIDSMDIQNRPKLVYLLPFRLDRIDLMDKKRTEGQIRSRKDIKYALGLYTGAMVALDSIKNFGLSVEVSFYDTERKLEKVKNILRKEPLYDVDAIIGPVDPGLLGEVAVQASNYNVPVLAPFAAESELSLGNVFFSLPKDEILREHILSYLATKRTNENVIIIADSSHYIARDSILKAFPVARKAKVIDDQSLHLIEFMAMLSEREENWVFVETDKPNMVSSVSSILNSAIGEEIKVKMFTTNMNNAFDNEVVSITHLSNLNFTFPSTYREVNNDSFTKAYKKKYGHYPDRYAVRGFDLTFDLLLKLAHKKNLFETSKIIGQTEYSGNRFDYANDWSFGFFNTATYLMEYDELQIKEIE